MKERLSENCRGNRIGEVFTGNGRTRQFKKGIDKWLKIRYHYNMNMRRFYVRPKILYEEAFYEGTFYRRNRHNQYGNY